MSVSKENQREIRELLAAGKTVAEVEALTGVKRRYIYEVRGPVDKRVRDACIVRMRENDMTHRAIAEAKKISTRTVSRVLKRAGVK